MTSFATDDDMRAAALSLSGRLHVADLVGARLGQGDRRRGGGSSPGPWTPPVAYVSGRSLRIAELDGSSWELAGEDDPEISWGSAEFVAAEEMSRLRGYWWSLDSQSIAACRVDNAPVHQWFIGTRPSRANRQLPATPPPGAPTRWSRCTAIDGGSVGVMWDAAEYPYLTDVSWPAP